MREAIRPGLESQSSLVVEIFLLFGNKMKRLLRTQMVDCWEDALFRGIFSRRFIIFNHGRFFPKVGCKFCRFCTLECVFCANEIILPRIRIHYRMYVFQ